EAVEPVDERVHQNLALAGDDPPGSRRDYHRSEPPPAAVRRTVERALRERCPRASGRLAAVLGVLDDALALGLAGTPGVAEGDLGADLVLAHEVGADRAAQLGDDVLLGCDSLGLLDRVGHDGGLLWPRGRRLAMGVAQGPAAR